MKASDRSTIKENVLTPRSSRNSVQLIIEISKVRELLLDSFDDEVEQSCLFVRCLRV